MFTNELIKRCIRSAGFDIHRYNAGLTTQLIANALSSHNVDLVLDVGANIGQFALGLRAGGFREEIISFEPLSAAHQTLLQRAARESRWMIHPRCAIGNQDGELEIHVSGNSVSSSLLPMLPAHTAAAANSAYVGSEKVPVRALDSIAPKYLQSAKRPMLKIDTQGYEWQVLEGAKDTLRRVCGVHCELSLIPFYEGQVLWKDIMALLEREGFQLWFIERGYTDNRDGHVLQADATFFRL